MLQIVGQDTHISAFDRGLLYGDGFFTTARVVNGKVILWSRHRDRLLDSAARLGFVNFSIGEIEQSLQALEGHGVLKVLIARGQGERGYAIPDTANLTQLIYFEPLSESSFPTLEPLKLGFAKHAMSINPDLAGIKHLNRLDCVLARSEILSTTYDDLIMLAAGNMACTTQANLFFVNNNSVITTDNSQAGVDGVMQSQVIDWLREEGYEVTRANLSKNSYQEFDECFITNAVKGILSVSTILECQFHKHTTARLMQERLNKAIDRGTLPAYE